jgi:hypothetical protein
MSNIVLTSGIRLPIMTGTRGWYPIPALSTVLVLGSSANGKHGSTRYYDESSARRALLEALAALCAILPHLRSDRYQAVLDALRADDPVGVLKRTISVH